MMLEYWGAFGPAFLDTPTRLLGYLLLLAYSALFLWGAYHYRTFWPTVKSRQWLMTLSFGLAAVITSQLFLVKLPASDILPPLAMVQTPTHLLRPLAFVPLILSAWVLPLPLTLLVGVFSGLGRALWQTHHLFDLFHYGLITWFIALALRQNYQGRLYFFLRQPLVATSLVSLILLPPLVGLAHYAYAPASASTLAVLDLARSAGQSQFWLALLEALVGAGLVTLLAWGAPQLRPNLRQLVTSPFNRTLRTKLISRFAVYSAVLLVVLISLVFYLSLHVASQLVVEQMERQANSISERIPLFRDVRQNLLIQFSQDNRLQSQDPAERAEVLRQLFRSGTFYRRVLLINATRQDEDYVNEIESYFPTQSTDEVTLTDLERVAINSVLYTGAPTISKAHPADGSQSNLSFVVPIRNEQGQISGVLLGRVADISLQELIAGLGDDPNNSGFIVDEENRLIAHPNPASLLTPWQGNLNQEQVLTMNPLTKGVAYEGRDGQTNARRLVYYVTGPRHPWTVVIVTPYESVLGLALQTSLPLMVVVVAATAIFSVVLAWLAQSITEPLSRLVVASQQVAAGQYVTSLGELSDDEVGQLGQAFMQMQQALQNRMEELSLLVQVSQSVTGSLNAAESMPEILNGALQGTGGSGARIVVLNPNGRYPLTFGEGELNKEMALFDRPLMNLIRQEKELQLTNSEAIKKTLDPDNKHTRIPFRALIGFCLTSQGRFQGILWVAYRQPHIFSKTEIDLVSTLANQAAVLMENARLFASAEGGRRRLAAVLDSTNDAVLVTDQTDRILLVNPAAERIFSFKVNEVRGRLLKDVVQYEPLVQALTAESKPASLLEVPLNGRTFSANTSIIANSDGHEQGRVAVFHDITHMKELDDMKSTFVQMVSHDLRSPLTYMNGFASMLPMVGDLNPKQKEYVEKIQRGIEQMQSLVKNLLDLGRLEAGLELMCSPVRLDNMITSIAEDYEHMAVENGIELIVERPVKTPYLSLDIALVRQAIINLVTNAFKYAPNSGPLIVRADVCPSPAGKDEVVITVKDNGPGIPKHLQTRLFEKFHRIQRKDNLKIKGSGLGLAIVKSVAERHGGRAWIESEEGQGSTFFLAFPLVPVDLLVEEK